MFRNSGNQNGLDDNINEYNDNSNQFYQKIHSSSASNNPMSLSVSYLDMSKQSQKPSFLTKVRQFFAKTYFFSLRRTQSPPSQNSQNPKRTFFRKPLGAFCCTKTLQENLFEQNNCNSNKNNKEQSNDKINKGISESKIPTEQNEQISNNKTINKDHNEQISTKSILNGSNNEIIQSGQKDEPKKQNPTLIEEKFLEGSSITEFEKQNFENESNVFSQDQNQRTENSSTIKVETKVVKKVRFQLPEKEESFKNWDDLSFSDESLEEEETYQGNWFFGKQEQSSSCITTALLSFI